MSMTLRIQLHFEYSAITGENEYIGEIQWDNDSNAKVHGTHVAGTDSRL